MTRRVLFTLSTLALCCVAGCTQGTDRDRPDGSIYGHLGGDFTLIDQSGSPFRLSEHAGVSLLFFGFTSCPDVCPLTMSRLSSVMDRVESENVTVLFVSVDPRRDTPERLTQYMHDYEFPLVGLTSDDASQIAGIARSFAAGLGRSSDGAIDHSSRIYLLDKADRVRDVFGSDDGIEEMVEIIDRIAH